MVYLSKLYLLKKRMKYDISRLVATELPTPKINIQNVVSTFCLGLKNLNLRQISQRLVFTDFNPPKVSTGACWLV